MGLSYDCASSVLLCAEDNNSILCLDDDDDDGALEERSDLYAGDSFFLMGFPQHSDECLDLMVRKELEHMPREDYAKRLVAGALDVSVRADAIDWILKVHSHYCFGPTSAYLSVNYLDRFLSAYELPKGKAWMTQLLSVACLSLGAKMEETKVPLCLDLQVGESKYVFEARTIQRMELLVLSTLGWRMQAVTPFSFIDYFLYKLNDDSPPDRPLVLQSAELLLNTSRGIDFLAFRPSEIAAAVAMSVLQESQMVAAEVEKAIDSCNHVDKERVLSCYELIQEVVLMKNNRHAKNCNNSVSHSPNGVLDAAACLSYTSDDHANSLSSPARKRRKISRHLFCEGEN